ncbi:MAG: DoxX family protein [Bacteroidales bacterium]|nr:DoxX family protein [Bacteroidales bacterium]
MKRIPLRRFGAALIGIVFLVSGLLKISDPVGTMLIVTEYLKFFHIGFLIPAAKGLGIALSTLEAFTGIALITGVLRKLTAWVTTGLLAFFTVITLILWIKNPEMDCGCFGQAIHLTHVQSLVKNVILLVLALWAFLPFGDFGKAPVRKIVSASIATASVIFAVVYCNTHLPLLDYTDFRIGVELMASLDDDIVADNHYREERTYVKDGQTGKFLPGYYPGEDWELVKTDTVFVESSFGTDNFPILSLRDTADVYCDRLAAEGKVVIFSVYNPESAPWESISAGYNSVLEAGGTPLVLLSCAPSQLSGYPVPAGLPVYFADYKSLISLNRSNGGATYLSEGEIIMKWAVRDIPADFSTVFPDDPVNIATWVLSRNRLKAQGFCLYLAALLILV